MKYVVVGRFTIGAKDGRRSWPVVGPANDLEEICRIKLSWDSNAASSEGQSTAASFRRVNSGIDSIKHVPGGELLMGGGHKGICVTR